MPLTYKGKKLKAKFRNQYGKKKGDSVFYAMDNSGKLKKVIKARGGGMDASSDDFSTGPSGKGDGRDLNFQQRGMSKKDYDQSKQGQNFGGRNNVTIRKGPKQIQVPTVMKYAFPVTSLAVAGINKLNQSLYNQKNLAAQKKVDVLGGEMLTTRRQTPITQRGGEGGAPILPVQPIIMNKPVDQSLIKPKENFFNFKAYNVGGLSGGVRFGPPPKRGPNPQVPPVKMKKGGYNK